jgi:P27 family predicted phage terminase small subunit
LGTIVKSNIGTPVENPYLKIAGSAQRQMRQWAGELGLTPAARKKVTRKAKEAEDKNDLADFLGIGRKAKVAMRN